MSTTASVKRAITLVVGLAVGALCLWLAFRGVASADREAGVGWSEIGALILGTRWWGWLGFFALFAVQLVLRVERWRVQVQGLTQVAPPSLRASAAVNAAGFAAVFLMPFRLGELVRPNLAAQRGMLPAAQGFAATALERVVDGMVTTGFFAAVMLVTRDREVPAYVQIGGWTALAVFGGALVVFVIAFRLRAFSEQLTLRVLSLIHGPFAEKIAALLRGFLDGLACFRRPRDLALYLAYTLAYWLLNAASIWVLMHGMGIDLPPEAALFCLCFLVIGVMIPAPPGNVGNFHAFTRAALVIFGVGLVPSVAFAIALHAGTVVGLVAGAAVFVASGDLSVARVRAATGSGGPPAA